MKILVTGGAGFIGSHIVDAYLNEGHEVVVVDNLSTGRRENLNPRAKFYQLDICSPAIEEVFRDERPEALNHHAAQIDVRRSVADPIFDCRVNIIGFLNLMEASRRQGVGKVIFASSGGTVYGDQKEFPADEGHPTDPVSPYGVAKLACEKYLHYYHTQYGIQFTALRYANIYGPRQNPRGEAGVVAIFIDKMIAGEQPVINGDGRQTRDYVYIGDVADINVKALGNGLSGVYNVGTGIETDVNTLFDMLCETVGLRLGKRYAPARPGEQSRSAIVGRETERRFGWSPGVGLPEGLGRTAEWFKKASVEPQESSHRV